MYQHFELPIKPVTCVKCLGKYIKTQGDSQEECLLCQRGLVDHKYENNPRLELSIEILSRDNEVIVYDWVEKWLTE